MMQGSGKQYVSGLASEFAYLGALYNHLQSIGCKVYITKDKRYEEAERCFNKLSAEQQSKRLWQSKIISKHITTIDPRLLCNGLQITLTIQKEIDRDRRDILCISFPNGLQIGFSMKHGNLSIGSPRLAENLPREYFGMTMSPLHWTNAFQQLQSTFLKPNAGKVWASIQNVKTNAYVLSLNMMVQLLKEPNVAQKFMAMCFGNFDHYKILTDEKKSSVIIEGININGTLNKSIATMAKPTTIVSCNVKVKSGIRNIMRVCLDNGMIIDMRVHNKGAIIPK